MEIHFGCISRRIKKGEYTFPLGAESLFQAFPKRAVEYLTEGVRLPWQQRITGTVTELTTAGPR